MISQIQLLRVWHQWYIMANMADIELNQKLLLSASPATLGLISLNEQKEEKESKMEFDETKDESGSKSIDTTNVSTSSWVPPSSWISEFEREYLSDIDRFQAICALKQVEWS